MNLRIAERFRPFSHTPGASCLIPGTCWTLQAFPTLICFSYGLQHFELALKLSGPVESFTLEQDLEKGCVWVFGRAKEGYFRLRFTAETKGLSILAAKTPEAGILSSHGVLQPKVSLLIPLDWTVHKPSFLERLSLGSHKKQDWDMVRRRLDVKMLLPALLYLAQHVPAAAAKASFFPEKKEDAARQLASFFKAHCTNILVPRLKDEEHQGLLFSELEKDLEPCSLLYEAALWGRSLFIESREQHIHLLPHLPREFDCGRFLNVSVSPWGRLDMEWASSCLRKIVFRSTADGELFFDWPNKQDAFRVRVQRFEKGRYQKTTEPFMVKAGTTYFLDRLYSTSGLN